MGCVERGDLRAFLDEELPGAERVRIEEHLLSCTSCRNELE
ncbi:MAG: anti-sigma factor family protein, partial [Chloroflexota bacterium]